jgi:L-fuculose-phosphate aldolase
MSDPRIAVIEACRELTRLGLTHGKSGNISLRIDEQRFFLTPTGMAYEALEPDDIPVMDVHAQWFGRRRPSSEWRFHRDILKSRPEVNAIVHAHSPNASALACTGRGIPAFHYMVAIAGGTDIRCAAYHTFGTQELSEAAIAALNGRSACLLANHGLIALGGDLTAALALAGEVESLAAQYCTALSIGDVRTLDDAEMSKVIERFRTYGRQDAEDSGLSFGGASAPVPGIRRA